MNDSNIFVLGCIRTDSPTVIEKRLEKLASDNQDNIYFDEIQDEIIEQGFHATENHPDIRRGIYEILPLLNFRAFLVLVNKKDPTYETKMAEMKMHERYSVFLKRLLQGRLTSRHCKYVFYFETLEFPESTLANTLEAFFLPYQEKLDIEFHIVGKENKIMVLTDYLNFIFFKLLDNPKKQEPRMVQNFKLVKDKIALINYWNTNIHFSRKSEPIDVKKISKLFSG